MTFSANSDLIKLLLETHSTQAFMLQKKIDGTRLLWPNFKSTGITKRSTGIDDFYSGSFYYSQKSH